MPKITRERLLEVANYDKETGALTWRRSFGGKRKEGDKIGTIEGMGYIKALIDGEQLLAQRLVWLYVYGEWPKDYIEFVNGDRTDLRLQNLRLRVKKQVSDNLISQNHLKEVMGYEPETGKFRWLKQLSRRAPVGTEAGAVMTFGYRIISIEGRKYLAHRLAWFFIHGEWAPLIDHVNGQRDDNRIENLRIATPSQNAWNSGPRSTNKSGFKGVSWSKTKKKWHARIGAGYRVYPLGYFDTKEEAIAAYKEAADRIHGEFAKTEQAMPDASEAT